MNLNFLKPIAMMLLGGLALQSCNQKHAEIKIIPEPVSTTVMDGWYRIPSGSPIVISQEDGQLKIAAKYLRDRISEATGVLLEIGQNSKHPAKGIYLEIGNKMASDHLEGYTLEVNGNGVTISGNTGKGVFYGIQTLLQLLPPEIFGDQGKMKFSELKIPQISIQDEPRYSWRGMHLDVGRHIFPVVFIKKYIDLIAMHKMNVFHWHLTEDQGWRIQINKYPKLTEIGSVRKTADGGTYGGFYTQEQIKEVVEYAKSRFVDVMPEIELPGHSVAALAAYPELSCTGGPFEVKQKWGVDPDVYCAGKEATFDFLEDVLAEVIDLFPFEYIHIGGDECPKIRWEECPDCQARIKAEGLKDEHELQSYFIQRIEKYLNAKNKKLVGWDEILEGGLAPEATVMSWRGVEGGIDAARQFHDVIMSPNTHCYFDYYQGDPQTEPKAIGGFISMEKVYSYEPTPAELSVEQAKHILGAQGNVWTEYIDNEEYVEYMAVPRMTALAEVVWTPNKLRDYEKFLYRMDRQYERLDAMDVNYRVPTPVAEDQQFVFMHGIIIELHKGMDQSDILYTLDGSDPKQDGLVYSEPLELSKDLTVKAITRMRTGKMSEVLSIRLDKQEPKEGIPLGREINGLSYTLYEGTFSSTEQIESGERKARGELQQVELLPDFPLAGYGLVLEGYVKIDQEDIYRFYTRSDDGSVLYVAGEQVVDNDGLHASREKSGQIALGAGWHPIKLLYFQTGGGSGLGLAYSGPAVEKQAIPLEKIASMATPMMMIMKKPGF